MKTVFDVPADKLIAKVKERLKEIPEVKAPEWLRFVKSGSHKERSPEQPDFWHIRCASLLRQVYLNGPIGVSEFRKHYGGRKRRGVARKRKGKASGSIIRKALQQLEKAGLVEKKKEGRVVTPKGRAFLDAAAREIA